MDLRILNVRVPLPVIYRSDSGSNAITTIAPKLDPAPAQERSEPEFWDGFYSGLDPELTTSTWTPSEHPPVGLAGSLSSP